MSTVVVTGGRPVTVVNVTSGAGPTLVPVGVVRPSLVGLVDVDAAGAPVDVPLSLRRDDDGVFHAEPAVENLDELVEDAVHDALDEITGAAAGYRHEWSTPSLLVQVQHGLPFAPAGVLIRDEQGALVDPGDVTHPLPGITEIRFGVPIGPATAWLS